MGRAIVREPSAFLIDEPLSNLDAKLRVQMRAEISRIQKRLETTTVYVTHDQTEAMTLGDRVVVMRKGVLQQVGSPQELYDEPGQPLRRRLHRLPVDELHAGRDLRRRPRSCRSPRSSCRMRRVGRSSLMRARTSSPASAPSTSRTPRSSATSRARRSRSRSTSSSRWARSSTSTSTSKPTSRCAPTSSTSSPPTPAPMRAPVSSARRSSPGSTPRASAKRGEKLTLWMDAARLHFFDLDSGERIRQE